MTTKLEDIKKALTTKEVVSKDKQCEVKGGCSCEDRRRPGRGNGNKNGWDWD
jgi:hypothetical protein